jgi:hypothetical protein
MLGGNHAMRTILLCCCAWVAAGTTFAKEAPTLAFENAWYRYSIGTNGSNVAFVDRASGKDYLRKPAPSSCAVVKAQGRQYNATSAAWTGGLLTLHFGDSGITAILKTELHPSHVGFAVESISGGEIESLTFLHIPLALKGHPSEPFGACALSLNLATRVDTLPALQTELRASCEKKFGLVGAKVALVGAPMARMLPVLQETLAHASELPVCRVAGPWARAIPFNHGSYLFNFGSLTETNLDDWIEMTRSLGFTQIDNHGGGAFFRFGDMELNRQKWTDVLETWRGIVARLLDSVIG